MTDTERLLAMGMGGTDCVVNASAVVAHIAKLEAALRPFAIYAEKRDAQPLRGMGDSVHSIHTGTPHAAEITLQHCRAARDALSNATETAP